jgi:hypothetical protein
MIRALLLLFQVGFERSATRDDVRVTLSLETLEEIRDAGSVTRVNSNSYVSKVLCSSPVICLPHFSITVPPHITAALHSDVVVTNTAGSSSRNLGQTAEPARRQDGGKDSTVSALARTSCVPVCGNVTLSVQICTADVGLQ